MTTGRHGLIFDEAAGLYDRYRPGYPARAIDDLFALAAVPPGASVLEVGAGTGQATMSIIERGMHVTAVEPAPRMAARLQRRLAAHAGSRVIVARFEDADLPAGAFDLVVSATAFHWIDGEIRYPLAARALREGGCLALIRNDHVAGPGSEVYYRLAAPIYAREAPELARAFAIPTADATSGCSAEVKASGSFDVIAERRYAWERPYTTVSLLGLLRTYSDHRALPRSRRAALFEGIRKLMDDDLGGQFTDHYLTTLCVAARH